MDNLEEVNTFLERYNLPRLNQEEIDIMNIQLQALKLKLWKKISQKTKGQDQMASQENSIKHLEMSQCLYFWNSSKKTAEKGIHPNSFYEATITLIPKPDKDNTKKKTTGQYHWWT